LGARYGRVAPDEAALKPYHGAYKPPREFNWVVGVVLLLLTLLLSFTDPKIDGEQVGGSTRRSAAQPGPRGG
jgi:hypothetical protein